MKKLTVSKIIDQYGWSYFFIAKEMANYSKHNIIFQKYSEFNYSNSDIILISSPNIDGNTSNIEIPKQCKKNNKIVIGQYSGETNSIYNQVDLIITISPTLYWSAKETYNDIPVIFLPEAIDTNYFNYSKKLPNSPLIVGWAGGPNKTIKRYYLLDQLKRCKIIKQMNHGDKFFTKDRTLEEMKSFYSKIDIFVLPSLTECMPRVIMEAMAMGKTCFATNVGSNSMLLSSQSLLTVYPDFQVLKELQEKIDNIQFNGERNRKWIESYFSWTTVMPIWDRVFEALINKDFNTIQSINNRFLTKWHKQFTDAKNKINLTKSLGYNYVHELYRLTRKSITKSSDLLIESPSMKNFILKIQKYNFWLIKQSCLYIINNEILPKDKLFIAVSNQKDYNEILELAKKDNINILIEINKQPQLKNFGVGDILFKVPSPVVSYLQNMFGEKWKDLTS